MRYLLCLLLIVTVSATATARAIDDYRWEGIERIIAIGDVHGDYDAYIETLRLAGVVNRRGRWIAGHTHLVQTGDIPDRGPDTRRIIRHLQGLARQAQRAGGRVHHLIGNHEAMNVYGDLRYVSDGEFQAFVDRNSNRLRDRYFQAVMAHMRENDPARYAGLPDDFREQWNQDHPLGWVEHRMAWDPRWDPDAELFQWVLASPVAVQLNDLIFVHGGISRDYCHLALAELNRRARAALQIDDGGDLAILEDETGPLWYRGLAGMPPATPPQTVRAILQRYDARHIVIGHTPTSGVIWPRQDGSIIMIDTGMSDYYGGHIGWLEISDQGLFAGYPGGSLELPLDDKRRLDYLERVIDMQPDNARLRTRLEQLREQSEQSQPEDNPEQAEADSLTICGIGR